MLKSFMRVPSVPSKNKFQLNKKSYEKIPNNVWLAIDKIEDVEEMKVYDYINGYPAKLLF